jgi:hypothetical protein
MKSPRKAWLPIAALTLAVCLGGPRAWGQVNGGASTANSLTVSTLTTGTVLDVTPSISADGRYVTMQVRPSFSSLDSLDTFVVPPPAINGAGGVGIINGLGDGGRGPAGMGLGPLNLRLDQVMPGANGNSRPAHLWQQPATASLPAAALAAATLARPAPGIIFVEKDKGLLNASVPAFSGSVTLAQAVKRLATLSNRNMVLGIAGFKKEQIDFNVPLAIHFGANTLRADIADLLAAAAPDKALVVTADDNVISIETQAQADHAIESKTYYAEDLIGNAALWLPKQTDPRTGENKPLSLGAAGSDNIMRMIAMYVRPEIWKSAGGKIGDMYQVGNRVTITAPQSVHALLDGPKHYNPNAAPLYINYSP